MFVTVREAGQGLRDLVNEYVRRIRRTQPVPVLTRSIAGVMALAALAVAAPASISTTPRVGLFVPIALVVALLPRTRFVTLTAIVAVLIWLLATIIEDESPSLVRVGLMAATLYLMHAAAAFAAVLPYDASVSREVLLRWFGRVSAVTVVGVGVGLIGLATTSALPTERSVIGPIIGSVIAVALVGVLAFQLRRR